MNEPYTHITMIREKQDADGWEFVFLSADLSAIDEAVNLGVGSGATLAFDKTGQGTKDAFASLGTCLRLVRRSPVGTKVHFADQDRAKQQNEKRRN